MLEDSEGRREMRFETSQREKPNSLDYAKSLEGLRRFAGLDLTGINNLKELSFAASPVGSHIKTVTFAKGVFQEKRSDFGNCGAPTVTYTYNIRKPVGDHEIGVVLSEGHSRITVSQNLEKGFVFTARVPFRDFHLLGNDEATSIGLLQASDRRFGATIDYYPTAYPNDPGIVQGFAGVLQESVKELLSVLPEPAAVPEVFNF